MSIVCIYRDKPDDFLYFSFLRLNLPERFISYSLIIAVYTAMAYERGLYFFVHTSFSVGYFYVIRAGLF